MPNPNPATPTSAALAGAEQWAVAYRQAHPDEPTAVVLITDGEPQGCDMNADAGCFRRDSPGALPPDWV